MLAHPTGDVAGPFRGKRLSAVSPIVPDRWTWRTRETATCRSVAVGRCRDPALERAGLPGRCGIITAAYRAHIDSEINDQYRTIAGSLRFLNNIVRFPGCGVFDAEASFIAFHSRRIAMGLILCSRVRNDVGHVTQVCVLPEHRGEGIGEALMAANLQALRRRKFHLLSLTVTEANNRAVELYPSWASRRSGCLTRLCGKNEEELQVSSLRIASEVDAFKLVN